MNITKLKKTTKLNEKYLHLALGWLSKEKKNRRYKTIIKFV